MSYCIARSGQADSMRQAFLWAILPTLVLFLVMPSVGNTQATVVTDITPSDLPSCPGPCGLGVTIVDPPSPGGTVTTITGGARPGDGPNLFHSFGNFSIGQGDIANFLNDSGLATTNIIGRVTGGNLSNIYGTIQTTDPTTGFGNANLFLVNPFGFVFGPQGSFDVGGSVSFSTAQYLRLFDSLNGVSANFYADPAYDIQTDSVFAMAPLDAFGFLPAAYGFLTAPDPSATITVQGSDLSVLPGQSISLVGREVVIQDATLPDGTIQQAHLSAPDGSILLASAASPGEFDVATLQSLPNVDGVSGVSFTSFGSVSLARGSSINVTGANTVFVKGGQLVLSVNNATLTTTSDSSADSDTVSLGTGSSIVTSNSGGEPGADVQITVGKLNLDGAGTAITTGTFGDGNGGSITANVETLSVSNGAAINSSNISFGLGVGGNITVQGLQGAGSEANLATLDIGAITTQMWLGPGEGGDISITANTLLIDNLSLVTSDTLFGTGEGGDLVLNVRELTVSGGSIVRTADLSFGFDGDFNGEIDPSSVGSGGDLTIRGIGGAAADSVVLSGDSLVGTQAQDGTGGSLSITTSVLSLGRVDVVNDIDISSIFTSTAGYGRGGNIDVRVQEATFLGGATIASQTTLFDETVTAGTGGNITMRGLGPEAESKAESLTIKDFFSGITSNSFGLANPGEITVYAKTVSLRDQAVIEGGNTVTTGTGGRVTIVAESVDITGGSHISSHAFGLDAGQVTITANELTLDNGSIVTSTASPVGGRGGDVVVNGRVVSLVNGSTINSSTSGTGPAGDLNVLASGSLTMTNGSTISASSTGSANAGDISINSKEVPGGTFEMWHSTMSTSAALADGGNIGIYATNMVRLTDSIITSSVGNETKTDTLGGNITIDPQFVILQSSQIRANAFAGTGGNIDIIAAVFIADPSSLVTASSDRGISGIVNIQSPLQNVGEELTPLSEQFSSAAALLAQQCAARAADGKFSTFVVAAREGLPAEPGGFLASPSWVSGTVSGTISAAEMVPDTLSPPIQLAKLGNACHQ